MSNTEYLPEEFNISYSNSNKGKIIIKLLNQNSLTIMTDKAEIIKPEKEEWETFWEEMEKIAIWDLNETYSGCNLEGGFKWEIKLSYKNKELNSYGLNYEPKLFIGNEMISIIEELSEAIYELSGFYLF